MALPDVEAHELLVERRIRKNAKITIRCRGYRLRHQVTAVNRKIKTASTLDSPSVPMGLTVHIMNPHG